MADMTDPMTPAVLDRRERTRAHILAHRVGGGIPLGNWEYYTDYCKRKAVDELVAFKVEPNISADYFQWSVDSAMCAITNVSFPFTNDKPRGRRGAVSIEYLVAYNHRKGIPPPTADEVKDLRSKTLPFRRVTPPAQAQPAADTQQLVAAPAQPRPQPQQPEPPQPPRPALTSQFRVLRMLPAQPPPKARESAKEPESPTEPEPPKANAPEAGEQPRDVKGKAPMGGPPAPPPVALPIRTSPAVASGAEASTSSHTPAAKPDGTNKSGSKKAADKYCWTEAEADKVWSRIGRAQYKKFELGGPFGMRFPPDRDFDVCVRHRIGQVNKIMGDRVRVIWPAVHDRYGNAVGKTLVLTPADASVDLDDLGVLMALDMAWNYLVDWYHPLVTGGRDLNLADCMEDRIRKHFQAVSKDLPGPQTYNELFVATVDKRVDSAIKDAINKKRTRDRELDQKRDALRREARANILERLRKALTFEERAKSLRYWVMQPTENPAVGARRDLARRVWKDNREEFDDTTDAIYTWFWKMEHLTEPPPMAIDKAEWPREHVPEPRIMELPAGE
ncbi:hypothetical protein GGR56DRAFT_698341 [Xylariaceae sp. FL0804]|nr:hypothetical protein GGR56DRAFT_698341 [Xylariaceae sp. FL0804]